MFDSTFLGTKEGSNIGLEDPLLERLKILSMIFNSLETEITLDTYTPKDKLKNILYQFVSYFCFFHSSSLPYNNCISTGRILSSLYLDANSRLKNNQSWPLE